MIILTKAQADLVRGRVNLTNSLAPRPLNDGTWVLPEKVLDDPVFTRYRTFLSGLPKATVTVSQWDERDDWGDSRSWVVGQLIVK